MKQVVWNTIAVISLFVACKTLAAAEVAVGVEVRSVNDFYEPLSTQGYWVEVGSYGRCWHPYYVDATWRPYCDGTWVWTDAGWYWESDEPWGWACYHYGRWSYDSYYGWVWMPDTVWGPSWVEFREGGGYCGWAPLPPRGVIVEPNWFVFVGVHHFGERIRPRTVIINNTTVINRTKIIDRTRRVNNAVIHEGPRVETLQKVNRARIQSTTVQEARKHERVPPSFRNAPQERPAANAPERERPRERQPEIIRGEPNAPPSQPPGQEKRERNEPQREERKERIEPRPVEPPQREKIAPPPPQRQPPPQEQRNEERGKQRPQQDEDDGRGHGRNR